jgi:hypothetical protein
MVSTITMLNTANKDLRIFNSPLYSIIKRRGYASTTVLSKPSSRSVKTQGKAYIFNSL